MHLPDTCVWEETKGLVPDNRRQRENGGRLPAFCCDQFGHSSLCWREVRSRANQSPAGHGSFRAARGNLFMKRRMG
ncbi:hypothetical protein SKAU_G00040190 [Synaphobranchus kaupii]|uniref:Uncharacterized protein n=1 Tax=Synaphobranchus kaupii TaxID=118154 RepID=A0A9Q1J6K1_SYNKA|nr:hypothetical protein SKAU_G00040190 [Synaphobranchus kaupii]